MASKLQGARSGGSKHPEDIFLFLQSRLVKGTGGIYNKSAGGFLVEQEDVPAMSVKVNDGGFAFLRKSGSSIVYPVRIYDGDASVVISSNSSGSTRIDAIVLYADLGVSPDEDILNVYKLVRVAGTPAGSPVPPSDATIESTIGANNPYTRLANVTVASGATTIVNANISDQRTEVLLSSYGVPVDDSDVANKAYVDANGFNQYTAPTTTVAGKINFLEGTNNGTNKTTLKGADNQASDTTLTLPSATDTLVGKATTDILTNKTLDTPIIRSWDGWMDANETWTYASASTFTISGDKTSKYYKGVKLGYTQTTQKYAIVNSAVYAGGNTTITIMVNTDYTIANASLDSPKLSYALNPQGFPSYFNFSPINTGLSLGNGTMTAFYRAVGKRISGRIDIVFGSTSSFSGTFNFNIPSEAVALVGISALNQVGMATAYDAGGTVWSGATRFIDSTHIGMGYYNMAGSPSSVPTIAVSNTAPFTWTTSDELHIDFDYTAV